MPQEGMRIRSSPMQTEISGVFLHAASHRERSGVHGSALSCLQPKVWNFDDTEFVYQTLANTPVGRAATCAYHEQGTGLFHLLIL